MRMMLLRARLRYLRSFILCANAERCMRVRVRLRDRVHLHLRVYLRVHVCGRV
jgi:hypothetical protein